MAAGQTFITAPDEASSVGTENASSWNLFYFNLALGFHINIHLLHLHPGTSNLTRPLRLCTIRQGHYKYDSIAAWWEPDHWQMASCRKGFTSCRCMSTWRAVVLNSGIGKQFWAELQRIPSEEAYSCNLRQTIRADTRRSSCHLQRSHPWGPMFHCYSAYNSQTHCNLQERERKTQLWVVQVIDTKETLTQ